MYLCPFARDKLRSTKACRGANGDGFPTLKGWKGHMTRQHGSYSDTQLNSLLGATAPDPEQGRAQFLAEADGVSEAPAEVPSPATSSTSAAKVPGPAPEPVKRVTFKSKKLKKFFSSIPEVILKSKGIEPDEDDKELIDTATEMLEEMFGVAFEVPEDLWVIRSRWLAMLFPFGAIVIIWAKHMLPGFLQKQAEEKEQAEVEVKL